ncbi:preprotein translocase subunit SecY [Mycoplasmopsis maculosa]|uniref:Protein translocase subunit SecY n=1 Tax=Mycoplasmopsis maculosa TaxID=114885 RepID=A0A449B3G0_9BACT|nr:preprotein translocase subunit SecY [Mycoplasmopsis maculosa]VEU75132.1 preprotein translocase subunit SecY [Mycoplasmopsis maculosa]
MKNIFKDFGQKTRIFFQKFSNKSKEFWTNHDLLKKFFITIFLICIYLVCTSIKSPFVRIDNPNVINDDTFLGTLNLIGGGGLRQFSLVAIGISPFINASLIMSLLQTKIFPPIYKLTQAGPEGRKKINIITRILTVIIAIPQALTLTLALTRPINQGGSPFIQIETYGMNENLVTYFLLPLILVGGSLFALFISEEITNKGIGNGTSLIIFVGIAFQLPQQFQSAFTYYVTNLDNSSIIIGVLKFLTYLIVYLALIFLIAVVYNAERHVPIQQIGAGRSKKISEMGKLPIKLNPSGVMPMIFASLFLSLPVLISRVLPWGNSVRVWIESYLGFDKPLGLSLLVLFTFFFSYIMGLQQSKVDKISEDFAKNSTFIPGINPGEDTENYLVGIILRLSTFSAFYLVLMVSFQYLMIITLNVPAVIAFGGTGMMILVSVALETIQQYMVRRKTAKLSKQKRISRMVSERIAESKKADIFENKFNSKTNNSNEDGLLW